MESYEAIARAVNRDTTKHAKALQRSTSLLQKWMEPATDFTDSGALNPLDRIETIIETSLRLGNKAEDSLSPIFYLCERFDLSLPYRLPERLPCLRDVSSQLCTTIKEFGEMVTEASEAMRDGVIDPQEARRIEREAREAAYQINLFVDVVKKAVNVTDGEGA